MIGNAASHGRPLHRRAGLARDPSGRTAKGDRRAVTRPKRLARENEGAAQRPVDGGARRSVASGERAGPRLAEHRGRRRSLDRLLSAVRQRSVASSRFVLSSGFPSPSPEQDTEPAKSECHRATPPEFERLFVGRNRRSRSVLAQFRRLRIGESATIGPVLVPLDHDKPR